MRMGTRAALRYLTAAVLVLAGLLVDGGRAHAAGLSCTGVPTSGNTTYNPISCTVDCARGGTIASAVAFSPRTTGGLTITVNGICKEALDFVPGGITLQAAHRGDGLKAPTPSANPVLGISGGVTLNNLTISGGVVGLLVYSGVTGNKLLIEGASDDNVQVVHGSLTLNNSTVQNSQNNGIYASDGAAVFLNDTKVKNNVITGIFSTFGAAVQIYGGSVISNDEFGGLAENGGSIHISDGTVVKDNSINGLLSSGGAVYVDVGSTVSNNSTVGSGLEAGVAIYGGTAFILGTIQNNRSNGVLVVDGGSAIIFDGATVQSNSADGIDIENGTIFVGEAYGPATIESNKGNGIFMQSNSVASFFNSGNKIIHNDGWGILCAGAPANPLLLNYGIGTVSGNKKGQISCKTSNEPRGSLRNGLSFPTGSGKP